MSEIVTANRLADGVVVFQDAEGGWSEDFRRGRGADRRDTVKAARWRAAEAVSARTRSSTPTGSTVELRDGHYVPKALREAIRASGPTVRRDLGKQAQGRRRSRPARARGDAACIAMTNSTRLSLRARVEQFRDQVARRLAATSPKTSSGRIG